MRPLRNSRCTRGPFSDGTLDESQYPIVIIAAPRSGTDMLRDALRELPAALLGRATRSTTIKGRRYELFRKIPAVTG
jgi:hypothetical protein